VNRFEQPESAVRRPPLCELREFHLKESVRLLTPFARKQREVEMETRYGFELRRDARSLARCLMVRWSSFEIPLNLQIVSLTRAIVLLHKYYSFS
jgi:hypothetical protein